MPASPLPANADGLPDPASIGRPWIASYPPGVPPTYRYPAVAVTRFLDDAARDFPDQTATRFVGAEIDYATLRELTDRFAAALRDLGVARGDRVGVLLPNLPATLIAVFAAFRLGAVVVPLDPDAPLDQVRSRLAHTGARALVCLAPAVPDVLALRAELPELDHIVTTGIEEWVATRRRLLFPVTGRRRGEYRRVRPDEDVLSMSGLIEASGSVPSQAPIRPTDAAAIVHTSGASGPPRAVLLTHGNLVASAFQARLWIPDTQAGKERVLAVLPFAHVLGLTGVLLAGVLSAQTLVLLRRWDASEVVHAITKERPSLFVGTGAMVRELVEQSTSRRHDLASLRACLVAGDPLEPALADRFEALTRGARLREVYGLAETCGMTHANPIYGRSRAGTIGLPVTDTVACVVDPDDPSVRVAAGVVGELLVRGPQVMAGYWRPDELTEDPIREGWLVTGDLVVEDEDGFFTFVERKKQPTALEIADDEGR